jgi:hypothetical protein
MTFCPANRWTQVAQTAGPFPYTAIIARQNGSSFIRIRRLSGGPPFYWEGLLPPNAPLFLRHNPADWYSSIEACPVGSDANVVGTYAP